MMEKRQNGKAEDSSDISQKPQEQFNLKKEILSWVETIIVAMVLVALIITFVGRMMRVEGSSMVPTLQNGERIITTPLYKELKHNDIVVIRRKDDKPLVKRIIGLPGDKININFDTHEVFVNDKVVDEPFINEPTTRQYDVTFPATVPEGCYFVMGDNRNYSDDSRDSQIGMIDGRNIFGKAVFAVWPPECFGKIEDQDYTY